VQQVLVQIALTFGAHEIRLIPSYEHEPRSADACIALCCVKPTATSVTK